MGCLSGYLVTSAPCFGSGPTFSCIVLVLGFLAGRLSARATGGLAGICWSHTQWATMPGGRAESPKMPLGGRDKNTVDCDFIFPLFLLCRWIEVFIPKFSISASYDLETILPKMGIHNAFDKNADFSGITKRHSLHVSKVSGWRSLGWNSWEELASGVSSVR